jgi:hypothetical protein
MMWGLQDNASTTISCPAASWSFGVSTKCECLRDTMMYALQMLKMRFLDLLWDFRKVLVPVGTHTQIENLETTNDFWWQKSAK